MLKGGGWFIDPWQRCICYIGLICVTLLQVESNTTSPNGHYVTSPWFCCGVLIVIIFTLLLTRSQHNRLLHFVRLTASFNFTLWLQQIITFLISYFDGNLHLYTVHLAEIVQNMHVEYEDEAKQEGRLDQSDRL